METQDVYRKLASQIFNIPEDQVTEDLRRRAKRMSFGQIYNQNNLFNCIQGVNNENSTRCT